MVKAGEAQCAALARDAASDEEVDAELERLPQSRDKWKELSRQLTAADGPAHSRGGGVPGFRICDAAAVERSAL